MEESRLVTPWANRLYVETPRASGFFGRQLVESRHRNLVPLLSMVRRYPWGGSGRCVGPVSLKCPIAPLGNIIWLKLVPLAPSFMISGLPSSDLSAQVAVMMGGYYER